MPFRASAPQANPSLPGWRAWWWLPVAWVTFGLLLSLQPWVWGRMEWRDALRYGLFEWGPWLVLGPGVVWLALRLPPVGARWWLAVPVHGLVCLGVAAALETVAELGLREARPRRVFVMRTFPPEGDGPGRPPPPDVRMERGPDGREWARLARQPQPVFMRLRVTAPLYALLVAAVQVLHARHTAQQRERRANRVEAQLAEARLAALQLQLQPHFLFNCLNAISSLVHEQPDKAEEMICALAALLRAALDTRDRREVALADELELAQRYMAIQQIRFAGALEMQWDIGPDTGDAAVPPLLLQPLLENAIVHGLRGRGGLVRLQAGLAGGCLELTVTDRRSGVPVEGSPAGSGTHLGLENTRARLEALYGPAATLVLEREAGGATARLVLPFRRLAAD